MEEQGIKRTRKPILMLAVGILGASMSSMFVKFSDAPSVLTATYRLLWVVLLMTPTMFARKAVRQELLHVKPRIVLLSAVSGIFLAIHFSTWFESLNHTSVASSTIFVCTEVIWVALGFRVFLKGRMGIKPIIAIIIALVGSVLIAWNDSTLGGSGLLGDALALTAAIAVAAYTLLGRVVRDSTSTAVYTYIVYVSCAVALTAASLIKGYDFFGYGGKGIISGFLLAVFSTILGHTIFSWCLKYFSPAFVSAAKLCEPVIASLFAALIYGEIPKSLQIAGSAVVLAGVLYYSIIELKKQKEINT